MFPRFNCVLIGTLLMLVAGVANADDTPAAIIREVPPGETAPPFVQLSPKEPAIIWDANEVGEFHLIDQLDQPVTRETLLGEQWVANFIFARCTTHCPLTSRKIMTLNEEVADVPVRFVTITVDPEHDTVAFMREFAETWKAKPDRWLFCTGKPENVWNLIRKGFKVAAWENVGTARLPGMEFAHTNQLVHVDKTGHIIGRYDSSADFELEILKKVIKGQMETPLKYRPATVATIEEWKARNAATDGIVVGDPMDKLPGWARQLPAANASLNSLATLLLLSGFFAVKAGRFTLHKRLMIIAFFVSIVFLAFYLTYHWSLHHYAGLRGKPFHGVGLIRPVYFTILISHVILAALVPVLAIITILNGLKAYPDGASPEQLASLGAERRRHHAWAKITFPIWLYVSVTGVIIYYMLYWI